MSLSMDVEELEKGRVDCQFEGESSLRQCRRYIETKSRQENILENSVKQALGKQHNVTNSLEELKGAMAEQKGAMAEMRGAMAEQQGATAELRSATVVLQNDVTRMYEFLQQRLQKEKSGFFSTGCFCV